MKRLLRLVFTYKLEIVNFIIGGVVLTFELTASRIVAPYLGQTIYSWTSIIGVILAALAIGYYLGGWAADKRRSPQDVVLFLLLAASMVLVVMLSKDWVLSSVSGLRIDLKWQSLLTSFILFAPATIVMGVIPPYLARLNIDRVATSGRHLARISAAGTLGSLVGTFLAGYVLFSFVSTNVILVGLAACLILTSFFMDAVFIVFQRLLFGVVIVLTIFLSPTLRMSGVIRDITTPYSRVVVRDIVINDRVVRVLQTDRLGLESGTYENGDKALVFDYARSFAAATQLLPHPKRILVVGGGAFTFPAYVAKAYPDAQVDVVEIDASLTAISKRYFGFVPTSNLRIITTDGRQFINHNTSRYDIIIVDAFSAAVPPFQLFTTEAVRRLHLSLATHGIVAVNTISATKGPKARLIDTITKTYQTNFKQVQIYKLRGSLPGATIQNLMLLAANEPLPAQLVYYDSAQTKVFTKTNIDALKNKILTDQFAPVEILAAQNYESY